MGICPSILAPSPTPLLGSCYALVLSLGQKRTMPFGEKCKHRPSTPFPLLKQRDYITPTTSMGDRNWHGRAGHWNSITSATPNKFCIVWHHSPLKLQYNLYVCNGALRFIAFWNIVKVLFHTHKLKVFWKPVSATYKKETKRAATTIILEL